jgi:hypothetical protein
MLQHNEQGNSQIRNAFSEILDVNFVLSLFSKCSIGFRQKIPNLNFENQTISFLSIFPIKVSEFKWWCFYRLKTKLLKIIFNDLDDILTFATSGENLLFL